MADHSGHRKRIIAKLDRNVLLEHELLEIFLFNLSRRPQAPPTPPRTNAHAF